MARDPFAGGAFQPGGIADPEADDDDGGNDSGGGGGGGGGGGSPGGSSPPPSDVGGPADPAPAPDPDPSSGGGDSPGGSSPPLDDVGGPSGPAPAPDPDPSSGGGGGPPAGPGPNTPGGLGDEDPGGGAPAAVEDVQDAAADAANAIASADQNEEVAERATTGGLLSERGENAGLLPPESRASVPGREDLVVDTSETRLRETAEDAATFRRRLDLGAAFSSPADPTVARNREIVDTSRGDDLDVGDMAPLAPDPANENPAEEFVEGGAGLPADLPGAALETETLGEAGQALATDDLVADFGADTVAETGVAAGRERAERTAAAAAENPAGFAGGVAVGAVVGAGALSRGRTGTFRDAVRAELDPRIGPFGRTFETRAARGFRDFLGDDRGQAELLTRQERRDPQGESPETGEDDALGPDVGPFDRSDARLFDPAREFGDDVGGMAERGPTVDPEAAESRQDIGGGIGGRGEAGIRGSDAESFSERGFGDVEASELDPNPTDTLDRRASPTGAATGSLFGLPGDDTAATGAGPDLDTGAGNIPLFAPGELNRAPTDLGGDVLTDTPGDTRTDQPTDVFSDQPTDTTQDTPTDLFDPPRFDQPTDTPTDPPTDTPTDTPTDPPSDTPTDPPTDTPGDPPEDKEPPVRFQADSGLVDSGIASAAELRDTGVVNPVLSLSAADDRLVDSLDRERDR